MPITLNHSNIGVQYSTGSNYIIETVKSDLYRRNEIVDTITRDNIQTAPVTPIISIQDGSNVYAVESYTYSGSGNTADFTRVFTKSTTCDILIVGGGGGGGTDCGGGGGGGGVIYAKNVSISANTYTIKVGKGGAGMANGISSEAFGATANGGGSGGGGQRVSTTLSNSGGSGGGGGLHNFLSTRNGGAAGTNTIGSTLSLGNVNNYNGNVGGTCPGRLNGEGYGLAGGGGGAGSVGIEGINSTTTGLSNIFNNGKGKGGDGVPINITGQTYYWAAGGGGGTVHPILPGAGGRGGGGGGSQGFDSVDNPVEIYGGAGGLDGIQSAIAPTNTSVAEAGFGGHGAPNTGSGGGGGGYYYNKTGGSGGSGIVIIRYLLGTIPANNLLTNEPVVVAPAFTENVRTFAHSGGTEAQTTHTITVGQNTICDILIVGGGGGGGKRHGAGGGAGTLLYHKNVILNGTYNIKVGKGGTGVPSTGFEWGNTTIATSGNFSQFIKNDGTQEYYAEGGGRGGGWSSTGAPSVYNGGVSFDDFIKVLPSTNKFNGQSVGVSNNEYVNTLTSPEGCRGNRGGIHISGTNVYRGGGGGGAGSPGQNHDAESTVNDGYGGLGLAIDITGTTVVYAGGGSGSDFYGSVSQVFDPSYSTIQSRGGGGYGSDNGTAQNGLNGTGGGGGGQGNDSNGNPSGNGGSGIVIIKFKSIINAAILDGITHKMLNFAFNQGIEGNIIAYYKFNGNYLDSNPYNTKYHLSTFGTPEFQTTRFIEGQSVLINADNEYLATAVDFPNQFRMTYSFWFLLDVITANRIVLGIGADFFIMLQPHVNKIYISNTMAGNETYTQPSFTFSSNTWYHLVLMFLSNGTWKLYMNGVDLNINGVGGTYPLTAAKLPTGKLFIGGKNIGYWTDTFHRGNVDEFYVFNKELSQEEITSLYNKTYSAPLNTYTLNFPVPTLADINNNSNIVLRGAYDIALSTSNALIIPKTGQYIPKPTTFASDLLSIRYNILNPLTDPTGAQWAYNTSNMNVCRFGSVGIGTTNPEYTLDVSGSVNAKSYYLNGRQINEPLSELGLSEGMIAQVRHLTYTQMDIKNNTGWDAINDNLTTGFVIAITPKSNLSKILLNIIVHIGLAATNYSVWWGIKLYRKIGSSDWTEVTGPNGTETGSAAATAGTPVWISNTMYAGDQDYTYKVTNVTGTYLDSPNTTSTVYYTAYWNNRLGDNPSAINTIYLNRAESHGDAWRPAPSSSWTASEIWYG